MDAGLQIKELAKMIGAKPGTVINWEIRGMKAERSNLQEVQSFIFDGQFKLAN